MLQQKYNLAKQSKRLQFMKSKNVLEQSRILNLLLKLINLIFHSTYVNTLMKEHHHHSANPIQCPQNAYYDQTSTFDLSHSHLIQLISGLLKQKYLSPYQNNSNTATGIIYGPCGRPMICLPVQPLGKKVEPIAIHFLIETGAPTSYLSRQALLAIFRVPELALIESNLNIWGLKIAVNQSCNDWQGINILGADYLRRNNLELSCVYNDRHPELEYCKLEKRG